MNDNWKYVPFEQLFEWGEKSKIKSGDGKATGKYKMFVCSDTEIKRYDDYLETGESLVFGTGGKASCHYVNENFAYSTDCVIAQKNSGGINTKFYYYYFRQNRLGILQSTFSGSGLQHTSKKKIEKILVPVLDYDEQQRIVSKIEELFSQLDSGVETLKKVKEQLKVYRQSVLKEAFSVCDLKVTVDSVCHHVTDGDHMPPPKAPSGVPFIMISNIKNNKINWNNTAFVNCDYYNNIDDKHRPQKNDVLYTVTGSFGIPVLIDFEKNFCFQRHIALLRPKKTISQKFLYYVMQEPNVYLQASRKSTGTAQRTVGLGVLRKIEIPFVKSMESQLKIVNKIESRLSVCDSIEKTIDKSLQEAEALRQSILKQAFEGGL